MHTPPTKTKLNSILFHSRLDRLFSCNNIDSRLVTLIHGWHRLAEISGFQPGAWPPEGCEPFLEGSRVDILCTQPLQLLYSSCRWRSLGYSGLL